MDLRAQRTTEADSADRALEAVTETITVVPSLWHTEIANVLLIGERRKIITRAQTIDYLTRLTRLPIEVDQAAPSARVEQTMALAREHGLTSYDATYLDLALRTNAILATFDVKLAEAMRRAGGKLFCA